VEGTLPPESQRERGNVLTIRVPGDAGLQDRDQVLLDWVEVDYSRRFAYDPSGLPLRLAAGVSGTATVTGIPADSVDLYDVTAPEHPRVALGLTVQAGAVALPLSADKERVLFAVAPDGYVRPSYVQQPAAADLRTTTEGADYIVIAYDGFVEAVRPLAAYRARQGLRVRIVPVSAVYDGFSGGVFTPVAIRDFLAYAHQNWAKPAPRYVLLVGDASYDYRDYLGTGERNFVPAYPVRLVDSIETPTDAYYVRLDGKAHAPAMAIGRLPCRTVEDVSRLAQRIVDYETSAPVGDWRRQVLAVGDHELPARDATWFELSSDQDARLCEAYGMAAERVFLRAAGISPDLPADQNQQLVREKATPPVLQALGQGCALFLFQGHGACTYLGRQRVLQSDDLSSLDNRGRSPLAVLVTCFAGAFDDPECEGGQCLAERLLSAPSGAIACVAPTRLGGANVESPLLGQLLAAPRAPVGEAVALAKQRMADRRVEGWQPVDNYNLLGDPLLALNLDVQPPPTPTGVADVPAATGIEDADRNRVADALERRVADGTYRRWGDPAEGKARLFCALSRRPTRADVEAVEQLGGYVVDLSAPPWGMDIILPVINVAPLLEALPSLTLVAECQRPWPAH
jgi:hypothetical protein